MKKTLTTFLSLIFSISLFAAGGFFDSFVYTNQVTGPTFYDLSATTGNPDFQNTDLGDFVVGSDLMLLGGQIKTFKNNGTDITGAALFYRIYPVGSPSGFFTPINYNFQFNIGGGGDQQWGTDAPVESGVEILGGLPVGSYVLELFVEVFTNGVNAPPSYFDSNGGANYQATFDIVAAAPVELVQFSAVPNKTDVNLKWQTSSEQNNSHFDVERSSDSRNWTKIGEVKGGGDADENLYYQYTDNTVNSGLYYYRLKQVDFNGEYEYSFIVSADLKRNGTVSIFPNPVREDITIQLNEVDQKNLQIQIIDLNGKLVASYAISNDQLQVPLNLTNLTKGMYLVNIINQNGGVIFYEKLLKL